MTFIHLFKPAQRAPRLLSCSSNGDGDADGLLESYPVPVAATCLLGLLDPARSTARWPYERAGRVAILRYQRAMLGETAAIETPSHPQMLFRNEINVGQAATGKTAGSFTIAR